MGRLVDQRYPAVVEAVSCLRADAPDASADELADLLIRRCARELAIGGAVAGGAAAAPVAGFTVAAASVGADATYSMGRLSELIMGIGLIYGHDQSTVDERTAVVLAVLGLSESAAVGLTGIAARVGSRSGARLVAKLPAAGTAPAGAGATRRAIAKLSSSKGPWSLAALIPYGIGAGIGAAGNAVLARSVGSAAKQYFAANAVDPLQRHAPIIEDAGEGDIVEEPIVEEAQEGVSRPNASRGHVDIVDAIIVDAVIIEEGPQ